MGHRLTPKYLEAGLRDYLDSHVFGDIGLSFSKTCSKSSKSDDTTRRPFMHGLLQPLRWRGGGLSTDDLSPNPNEGTESGPRRVTPNDNVVSNIRDKAEERRQLLAASKDTDEDPEER